MGRLDAALRRLRGMRQAPPLPRQVVYTPGRARVLGVAHTPPPGARGVRGVEGVVAGWGVAGHHPHSRPVFRQT